MSLKDAYSKLKKNVQDLQIQGISNIRVVESFVLTEPIIGANDLNFPWGLDLNQGGEIYVTDMIDNRVVKYSSASAQGVQPHTKLTEWSLGQHEEYNGWWNPVGVAVDPVAMSMYPTIMVNLQLLGPNMSNIAGYGNSDLTGGSLLSK